ncbi:MAG: hypothetical protein IPI73_26730 [Betaproteobacteria bacterium]|nr:hypothetical protein [Betaproteobacteria bacterium]
MSYASPGTGSPQHLGVEIIKSAAGLDAVIIRHKGGGQAHRRRGRRPGQARHPGDGAGAAAHQSGRLKALAVTGATRSKVLDVPTVADMRQPAVAEKLASIGMDTTTSATPEDFARMLQGELKRWPEVVKAAGIQAE